MGHIYHQMQMIRFDSLLGSPLRRALIDTNLYIVLLTVPPHSIGMVYITNFKQV